MLGGHHQSTATGPGTLRHLSSNPCRCKRRLDRIRGPQMDLVSGWEGAERQQHVPVLGELRGRIGILVAVDVDELVDAGVSVALGLGLVDLADRGLRLAVEPLRHYVQDLRDLVRTLPISTSDALCETGRCGHRRSPIARQ
jgi:hypothetical protein